MSLPAKIAAGLIALIALFGVGFYYGKKSVKPTTKIEYQEKTIEKVVYVEKTQKSTKKKTTVTKKPDGTEVTQIDESTEEKTDKQQESKKSSESNGKTVTASDTKSKYRLSLALYIDPYEMATKGKFDADYGLGAGARVAGPFWLESEFRWKTKELSLGVAMEL